MGLPMEKLVIASNVNDILPRTLHGGSYEMREVIATTSPSMDIQISSNFERYLFEASGRDAPLIRAKMRALKETSSFDLGSLGETMRRDFAAAAASEAEVAEAIVRVKAECGYLADPHTACAIVAAERELAEGHAAAQVVLSTAHPAKFPDAMQAITGGRPVLPERLAGLLTAKERFTTIDNDIGAAEAHVESLTRAVLEGRG
jgi:threonine synthase